MKEAIFTIVGDVKGIFIERINKFVGKVEVDNKTILAHIHDPGRLKNLLYFKNSVLLKANNDPKRITKYEVVAAENKGNWVLINSRFHNEIAYKLILKGFTSIDPKKIKEIKKEFPFKNSRFDFFVNEDKPYLVEVKGCTLVENGTALFPDAPTKRGTKHLLELTKSIEEGFKPMVLFLIFQDAFEFKPNGGIDPLFEESFNLAVKNGVVVNKVILSYDGKFVYFEKSI